MALPDSAFYNAAWKETRSGSAVGSHWEKQAAWQVFWDTFAPTYIKICRALIPENRKLIHAWQNMGLMDGISRALDIGCGPGTFTLPLAETVPTVVGLDTSPLMLQTMQDEALALNLTNIHTERADWSEVKYGKEFDLVLASNSPAVDSMETLMKMDELSRACCVYICYAGGIRQSLRNLLWEKIMGAQIRGSAFDITFPFNILYREGRLPHVSFHGQQYTFREETGQLLQNYRAYFKIFDREGPAVDKHLENILQSLSKDGWIEETAAYTLAVMWWDVRVSH